jgi:signal transduction histidine kinase
LTCAARFATLDRAIDTVPASEPDADLRDREMHLADEQAALRRVATLVASGAPPAALFAAVAREVAAVMGVPFANVSRFDDGGATLAVVASWGDGPLEVGTRWPVTDGTISARVLRTRRPVRLDGYPDIAGALGLAARDAGMRTRAGAPIMLDGRVWGVMSIATQDAPFPEGAEARLDDFTGLLATAISNSQAREDLRLLADEQAALRRVATLVAQAVAPRDLFRAVIEEVGTLLGADLATVARYEEADHALTVVAGWAAAGEPRPEPGTRMPLEEGDLGTTVLRTGRAARRVGHDGAPATVAAVRRTLGIHSSVATPIVVGGRPWGGLVVHFKHTEPIPADAEGRLENFAELIATAVANAQARADLAASRARIVEAADGERRRVVRDLHDGAQARLVHAIIALERARGHGELPPGIAPMVAEGLEHLRSAIDSLRELARGIHPAILTHSGLAAAVEALADSAPVPVAVAIPEERFPRPVESAAYFVVAEALTNIVKYARASCARITATNTGTCLRLVIEDDGIGGAKREAGRGLAGLGDRVAALDGLLEIDSPAGDGTRITAEVPLGQAT